MTSVEQVARMLSEIPYIQANPGISVAEVARVFSVSEDQVERDVTTAVFCGLPGGYPSDLIDVDLDVMDDEGSLYMHNPTPLGRPVRLTAAEAASLQVGLMTVRAVADPRTVEAIDSLLAKISAESGNVDVSLNSGDERIRSVIADAIAGAEQVELTYDGLARGTTTHPRVDPGAVTTRDGAAYLVGYDVSGAGWRTYRMDRIADVRLTGQGAGSHALPSPDAWAKSLAAGKPVSLTVTDQAAWIAEYYPVTHAEKLPGGGMRIDLPIVDPAFLVRLVLSLGDQVRAIEPDDAAMAARDLAREALRAYDEMTGEENER